MICPFCDKPNNSVVKDSRHKERTIHRRRECLKCKNRWTTVEYIYGDPDFAAMREVVELLGQIRQRSRVAIDKATAIMKGE